MRWLYRVPLIVIVLILMLLIGITVMSYFKGQSLEERFKDQPIQDFNTLDVGGYTMAYREFGSRDNPTVLLVHGFLGSSYDYRYLSERLEKDYHVIALDLIGFGASDKPADFDYSRASHASMIDQFAEAKALETFHLGGHSMGGAIALYYAYLYPDRLQSLLLFASAGFGGGAPNPLPIFFYQWIFKNYYLQRLGFQTVHHQASFQSAEYFDPMFYFTRQIPPETLQAFSQYEETLSMNDFIESIVLPTLIVFGTEDTWISPTVGETLNAHLENSRLVLIEETGHIPFIESVEETFNAVIEFLNE